MLAAPLVRESEGLRLSAYVCPAGVLTIGFGHTGSDVTPGLRITTERAEQLLTADLQKAATVVRKYVRVPLTAHQEAALVSFVFNVGGARFAGSTLLRLLNKNSDYAGVPRQLRRWTKGRVKGVLRDLPGLVTRRDEEATLWSTAA